METGKLTIMSVLYVLMRRCLGHDFVGKQSKDAFGFCHNKFVTKAYLFSEIINSIEGICHQKHEKLITFANYSNPSSSFVNIKVSVYTGIIPCFIPQKDNPELKQTFAQYGVNTPRLDRLGSKVRQRVHCLDATYVQCVLFKNDAIYGGSLGQK